MFDFNHPEWDWDGTLAALRCTQLAAGSINTTTATTVYTVPTGKRAIIKFVTAMNTTNATRDLQMRLNSIGTIWHMQLAAYGSAGDEARVNFWVVLNAGDQLKLSTVTAGQVDYTISGSEHTI